MVLSRIERTFTSNCARSIDAAYMAGSDMLCNQIYNIR